MFPVLRSFHDLRIRYKLLLSYSLVYILALTLGSTIIYSLIQRTLEENIESELKNSTSIILNMVKTSLQVSIKNHLRGVARRNRDILSHYYAMYKAGAISEEEAKARAEEVILSQKIGDTGYIYCLDSTGIVVVHPNKAVLNTRVSDFEFVRGQIEKKEGYMEYEWMNPGEATSRPKALYMAYFEPWDWIISVSSYRSEFNRLVSLEDFRDSILSLRFGKTGYAFVGDSEGRMVLHPRREDKEQSDAGEVRNNSMIKEMFKLKNGKLVYFWLNPGETRSREKLAIFNHIPDFDWIVACTSYLDEVYAPLYTLRNIFIVIVIVSLVLVIPLTGRISSAITNPLQELMKRFADDTPGDFSARVNKQSGDELGQLASYFNLFMERLQQYNDKLQAEIEERKQAEEGLRLSEEMFSKAFRLNPNAICILERKEARVINVNETFLISTGYGRDEIIQRPLWETALLGDRDKTSRLLDAFEKQGHVHGLETVIVTKAGATLQGLLSAEAIELGNEKCMLLTIEDVTDRKHLERQIMEIGDRERQRIGQDLHDDLCSHLIGVEMLCELLHRKLEEGSFEETARVKEIKGLIHESIEKTRGLARGLCPVHLVAYGLESSLRELCTNAAKTFQITCDLKSADTVLIHDNTVATHLFYIAQEALRNAVKHGRSSRVLIELSSSPDGLILLSVIDDGLGMREPVPANGKPRGMGLRIMSHRAQMIGGSFEIRPNPDGGMIVECSALDTMSTMRKEAPDGNAQI